MAAPIEAVPYAGAVDSSAIPAVPVAGMVAESMPATVPLAGLEATIPMAAQVMEAVPVEMAEALVHAETPPPAEAPPAAAAVVETPAAATPSAPTTPPSAAPTAAASAAPAAEPVPLPAGAQPRLLVLRGQKRNVEYPIYEGHNFIGRADEKPVDIDLEDQEPPDRIWSSRQHALITLENNILVIEDLNSSNGTFVNRGRIYPGQKRPLAVNDVVQIGNVQLKLIV
jgi:hypothetical protein